MSCREIVAFVGRGGRREWGHWAKGRGGARKKVHEAFGALPWWVAADWLQHPMKGVRGILKQAAPAAAMRKDGWV